MIYLVCYHTDNSDPQRASPDLELALAKSGEKRMRILGRTWAISTNAPVNEIYRRVSDHLIVTDFFLVVQWHAMAQGQGWLPQEAWDWLEAEGVAVQ